MPRARRAVVETFLYWLAFSWALFLTVGGVLLLLRRDGYRWTRKGAEMEMPIDSAG
ncbi:MAG: hypothetical protein WD030_03270 [Pirellulales bacterium]